MLHRHGGFTSHSLPFILIYCIAIVHHHSTISIPPYPCPPFTRWQSTLSICFQIFLPTARQAEFAAGVLSKVPGLEPIYEINSRLSQSKQTNFADAFAKAKKGVLLSSDVTARGMDFPGYCSSFISFIFSILYLWQLLSLYLSVTLVVQLGLPASLDQYIHCLGRTARAGAMGRGILVLSQEEEFFLKDPKLGVVGFPIRPLSASSTPPGPTLETVKQAQSELQRSNPSWLIYQMKKRSSL